MLNFSDNKQIEFLDLLNIMSFCIGIMNLNSNMTQNDKQDLQKQLNEGINSLLKEIHGHLQNQDDKIDKIMEALHIDS